MDTKPLPNEKYICASNERFAIVKNLLVVSFGFTLLFTSYSAISYLQSSLNKVHTSVKKKINKNVQSLPLFQSDGVGTNSLASLYVGLIVSCMFMPSVLIKKFTTKWALVVSMLTYSAYTAAQFQPEYSSLIPTVCKFYTENLELQFFYVIFDVSIRLSYLGLEQRLCGVQSASILHKQCDTRSTYISFMMHIYIYRFLILIDWKQVCNNK